MNGTAPPFRRVAFVMHAGWTFLFQRAHHFAQRFRRAGFETAVFELAGMRAWARSLSASGVETEQKAAADKVWSTPWPYNLTRKHPSLEAALLPWARRSYRDFARAHLGKDTLLWLHGVNAVLPPEDILGVPRHRMLLDVYDDFAGFFPHDPRLQARLDAWEEQTLQAADVALASAALLETKVRKVNPRVLLVRNAVSAPFLEAGATVRPGGGPNVAVYQGAFASWFDFELVEGLLDALPSLRLLLVGRVFPDAGAAMDRLLARPNVQYLGTVPHEKLAGLIAGAHVGLVPFRVNALTRATDPIKLYEYLACGLPVVSTPLPEVQSREAPGVVGIAATAPDMARVVSEMAEMRWDPQALEQRRALAAANTWDARFREVMAVLS